jgi:hypothetical protein
MLLLVLLGQVDESGSAKPSGTTPSPAASAHPPAPDVKDTRQRIESIYQRMGIKRKTAAPPKWRGCSAKDDGEGEVPDLRVNTAPLSMPPWLGWALIALVVGMLLVFIVIGIANNKKQDQGDRDQLGSAADEDERAQPPLPNGPWAITLTVARQLLAQGKRAEAFAALHRVALIALAQQSMLQLNPKATNWDYVRRLAGKPSLRRMLSELTIAAERSVLGEQPPNEAQFDKLAEELVTLVPHVA